MSFKEGLFFVHERVLNTLKNQKSKITEGRLSV